MTEELKMIMNLMDKPINIDTLRTIKEMVEKKLNPNYVKEIYETDKLKRSAQFFLKTKIICVNYEYIEKFTKETEQVFEIDTNTHDEKSKKLIKLLTAYRIILHEIHHAKQTYNIFETNKTDLETETIRAIYNIDKEEINQIENKDKPEMIEKITKNTNDILKPYSEINPIERKAEIESYKIIKQLITPIRKNYEEVYDEIQMQLLFNIYNGYDNETPFEQIKNIMNNSNLKYNEEIITNAIAKNRPTNLEKMEIGLDVPIETIYNIEESIQKILC